MLNLKSIFTAIIFGTSTMVAPLAAQDCAVTPEVLPEMELRDLADFWFGTPDFKFTILTATNARSGNGVFEYISDPNVIPMTTKDANGAVVPNHVCIPKIAEAERLKERFDRYIHAVQDMSVAEPNEEVTNLISLPAQQTVFVSWVSDRVRGFFKPDTDITTIGNTWVTLAPKVQEFCTDFTKNSSVNPDRLTLRLEQRLGLAPASSKTYFVEYIIENPQDKVSIFRPCANPDVTGNTCVSGGPTKTCDAGDKICHARQDFFYQQYYGSYGREHPVEFPWTSLGYTFDWGSKPASLGGAFEFEQIGENEFVIPNGANVRVGNITPTAQYCGLLK